jgi:hypothetical protein
LLPSSFYLQGFDLNVAQSAGVWLQVVDWVKIEAPAEGVKPLYVGASTREAIVEYMGKNNFELRASEVSGRHRVQPVQTVF